VDILSGDGLDAAMAGAAIVIDLANSPSFEEQAVMDFFRTAGQNLLAAEAKAGVRHHLALSIVGTDTEVNAYFRAKNEQERLIRASGIPYTIVRSTQFYDFLPGIIESGTQGDTVHVTTALVQLIAADDVAAAVTQFALQPPANGIVEIAGPERAPMADVAQRFMREIQDTRPVVGDAHTPYFGAEVARETLVPSGQAWQGKLGFDGWLAQSGLAKAARQ
jgi:uncharacterized protein YbjT (DUF2867 family)